MSKKTLVVAGYGPGISNAVAERFGKAGFSLALVSRNAGWLAEAVARLKAKGYEVAPVVADLSKPSFAHEAIRQAKAALGPATVLHWNAATPSAGDLLKAPVEELATALSTAAVGLVAAVQEALPDLRQKPDSAVLVTNGGWGLFADRADDLAVKYQSMGLAAANAAKHKICRMLWKRLSPEGVFLAELMVMGVVKGPKDGGQGTIEPSAIAERFWGLYEKRQEHLATIER